MFKVLFLKEKCLIWKYVTFYEKNMVKNWPPDVSVNSFQQTRYGIL